METYVLLVMHENFQFGGGLVLGVPTSHELQCTTKEEINMLDQLAPNKKNRASWTWITTTIEVNKGY
jgi:hypothetical protein